MFALRSLFGKSEFVTSGVRKCAEISEKIGREFPAAKFFKKPEPIKVKISCAKTLNKKMKFNKFAKSKEPPVTHLRYMQMQKDKTPISAGENGVQDYLYHLTTRSRYEAMMQTGEIRTAGEYKGFMNGIFMTDMENLSTAWHNQIFYKHEKPCDLSFALLTQPLKGSAGEELVLLRVSTKGLNKNILRVRDQRRIFQPESAGRNDSFHICLGENADKARKLQEQNIPYEYVYMDNIPLRDNVEVVGTARFDFSRSEISTFEEQQQMSTNIFGTLLKGSKEEAKYKF